MKPVLSLNKKHLQNFIRLAQARLKGRWALIGGSLLPLLGKEIRATSDIDFIGLGENEAKQNLSLMEIAEELKLPIETVNQAGALFLSRISDYENALILLSKTENCQIYRPNFLLYLKLKLPRLTESDQKDILAYYEYCSEQKEKTPHKEIERLFAKELKDADPARAKKLTALLSRLR